MNLGAILDKNAGKKAPIAEHSQRTEPLIRRYTTSNVYYETLDKHFNTVNTRTADVCFSGLWACRTNIHYVKYKPKVQTVNPQAASMFYYWLLDHPTVERALVNYDSKTHEAVFSKDLEGDYFLNALSMWRYPCEHAFIVDAWYLMVTNWNIDEDIAFLIACCHAPNDRFYPHFHTKRPLGLSTNDNHTLLSRKGFLLVEAGQFMFCERYGGNYRNLLKNGMEYNKNSVGNRLGFDETLSALNQPISNAFKESWDDTARLCEKKRVTIKGQSLVTFNLLDCPEEILSLCQPITEEVKHYFNMLKAKAYLSYHNSRLAGIWDE